MSFASRTSGRNAGAAEAVLRTPLHPLPEAGPMFTWRRKVRTGDVAPDERLRLDGVARYLQDIAFDHIEAMAGEGSGAGDINPVWVVRRSVIDVVRPITWRSEAHLQRWCSAMSTRWATMRVRIEGVPLDGADTAGCGGLIETEGFWININRATGAPARISEALEANLMKRTIEHRLRWRPWLTEPPPESCSVSRAEAQAGHSALPVDAAAPPTAPAAPADGALVHEYPFTLRATDIDPLQHLNNTVYLHPVEEVLTRETRLRGQPHRVVIEYLRPIEPGAQVRIRARTDDDAVSLWFLVDGVEHARAAVLAL